MREISLNIFLEDKKGTLKDPVFIKEDFL